MPGSHRTQPGRVMNRILETENSGKCLSYFLELWMIFFQVSVNLTPNVSIYIFSFIHNFSDESFFPTGSLLCTLPPPDTASQDHIRCLDAGWRMRSVQNPVIVVILDNINIGSHESPARCPLPLRNSATTWHREDLNTDKAVKSMNFRKDFDN